MLEISWLYDALFEKVVILNAKLIWALLWAKVFICVIMWNTRYKKKVHFIFKIASCCLRFPVDFDIFLNKNKFV